MTDVTVGHKVIDTIQYLDRDGNPMQVPVVPDSPPSWVNMAAATVDSLTVAADGSSATINALGAGQDTVTLTVTVNGQTFIATQQLNIQAAPQVLSSVAIAAEVV